MCIQQLPLLAHTSLLKTDLWSVQSPAPVFQQKHLAAKNGGQSKQSAVFMLRKFPATFFFAHPFFCQNRFLIRESPAPVFQQKYLAAKKEVGDEKAVSRFMLRVFPATFLFCLHIFCQNRFLVRAVSGAGLSAKTFGRKKGGG